MAGSLSIAELNGILRQNPGYKDIRFFFETGTNYGGTIFAMEEFFDKLYTVELSNKIYHKVVQAYWKRKLKFLLLGQVNRVCMNRIHFLKGDSVVVLKNVIASINEPIVFFLDAHWSRSDTARGEKDCPLLEELKIIGLRAKRDLIIIDDVRLFNKKGTEDWSGVSVESITACFPHNKVEKYFIDNDRMILCV